MPYLVLSIYQGLGLTFLEFPEPFGSTYLIRASYLQIFNISRGEFFPALEF